MDDYLGLSPYIEINESVERLTWCISCIDDVKCNLWVCCKNAEDDDEKGFKTVDQLVVGLLEVSFHHF